MRRPSAGRRVAWAIALVAAVLALVAFRAPVARGLVAFALGTLTGDRVSLGRLSVSDRLVIVEDFAAERPSGARLGARRVEIRYDLRELLAGGGRRYGLAAIVLTQPWLTIVRRSDGSFDLPVNFGSGSGGSTAGPGGPRPPLDFTLTIRDGTAELRDPNRTVRIARDLALQGFTLRLNAVAGGLRYRGAARIAGDRPARLTFAGRIDADGFATHRVRGSDVALPALADYFINSEAAALASGRARALDLRLYALPAAGKAPAYHLTGFADVSGGVLHVPGLVPPATGMHGRLDLYDDGLVTRRLDAHLGGAAVRLCGGLYGRMAPQFRLAVVSRTDLAVLRKLFRFSARLPLRGAAAVSTLLEGDVGSPLVATRLRAPSFAYGRFPVGGGTGRAIYHASAVDVVDARASYGGLAVTGNGAIVLGAASPNSDLAFEVRGPAGGVPYAAQVAPLATLHATGVVTGRGLRLDARGAAEGAGGGTVLGTAFHIDPEGDGAIGPLAAAGPRGSRLAGMWYFERSRSRSGFWLDARDFPYAGDGIGGRLPGLDLRAPAFRGTVDGAFAGSGPPSAFRLAGRLRLRALRFGRLAIDEISGEAAGAFGNLRLGGVTARGPWGTFRGGGRYAAGRLALEGRYDGSFERLRGLIGDLGGRGRLAGPLTLLADPERIVVQSSGAIGLGASVRGFPLDAVAGTLSVTGRSVRIYAATASTTSGSFTAAGDGRSGYGVSFAGAAVGLATPLGPLRGGRMAAIGAVTGPAGSSRFSGGLAVTDASLGGTRLSANGDLRYGSERASFTSVDALAAGTVARLAGNVAGLQTQTPALDVSVHVPSARVAPLAARFAPPGWGVAGTLAADLHGVGTAGGLRVTGSVALPEGTLAGLNFSDARADVTLDRGGMRARRGSVTVGSTRTRFAGLASGTEYSLHVNAPQADLSDFNDLFDAGDTLGGRGRVDAGFVKRDTATRTDADIAIAALRYRRFDLGDARAVWRSRGARVTGSIDFGGASGRLDASGVLVLPAHAPLAALLGRSRFDGRAQVAGLDLGVWLPALGYQLPVAGRLDATASFAGLLRNPAVSTVATLHGGSIGAFPVDRFEFAASSTLDRTTIRRLQLDLPSISIAGTGQFGLAPSSRVALALHLESPNLADLSARLVGTRFPVTGSASADVAIDGTRAAPRVAGRVSVKTATVRGVAVPQAAAAFVVRGRDVVLSDATVDFASGTLALDGSVPFEVGPLTLGPETARVDLTLAARNIALANFTPLLPAGSILRGTLGGAVTVGGTIGAPRLGGRLTLAAGTVQTPYERVPLTGVAAAASFDGDAARLDLLHASAGGGTLDAAGSIRFADLVRPGSDATYAFVARAGALHLDLPAYGSGTVDGTLSLGRVADGVPRIAGDLRLSDGTIPFSALISAGGAAAGGFDTTVAPPAPAPGLAFDLDVSAVRNVRVRSANIDIGGRGDLHVGGTLGAPQLAGGFTSTGGTITYFNTVFRLIDGTVTFAPELGVVPTLDARGVTHVINPDPNTVRNLAGTADVTLSLLGPVTNLTIGLSSDPSYDRQQILGLLLNAPALGASNLFGETRDQATLYGSNATATLPPGVATFRSTTGELSVAQEAFGIANAQFTRTLLAPIESTFASAVGLSNFNVNVDYTGNVGVSARKVLGKSVNAVYGSSFGYPYRQTFGFEVKPSPVTAAQVTVFDTLGQSGLSGLTPTTSITNSGKVGIAQPFGGTTGFSLSFQRLF